MNEAMRYEPSDEQSNAHQKSSAGGTSVAQRILNYQAMARRMYARRYDSPAKCAIPAPSRGDLPRSASSSLGNVGLEDEEEDDSIEEEREFVRGEGVMSHQQLAELEVCLEQLASAPGAGDGGEVVIDTSSMREAKTSQPERKSGEGAPRATMRPVADEAIPCRGQEFALRAMLIDLKALCVGHKQRQARENSPPPIELTLEGWRARFLANGCTSVGMQPSVLSAARTAGDGDEESDYTMVCTMVPVAYFFVRLLRQREASEGIAARYVFANAAIKSVPR